MMTHCADLANRLQKRAQARQIAQSTATRGRVHQRQEMVAGSAQLAENRGGALQLRIGRQVVALLLMGQGQIEPQPGAGLRTLAKGQRPPEELQREIGLAPYDRHAAQILPGHRLAANVARLLKKNQGRAGGTLRALRPVAK